VQFYTTVFTFHEPFKKQMKTTLSSPEIMKAQGLHPTRISFFKEKEML
jgi:hypothetical protein